MAVLCAEPVYITEKLVGKLIKNLPAIHAVIYFSVNRRKMFPKLKASRQCFIACAYTGLCLYGTVFRGTVLILDYVSWDCTYMGLCLYWRVFCGTALIWVYASWDYAYRTVLAIRTVLIRDCAYIGSVLWNCAYMGLCFVGLCL
ncbi:hypothetical protein CEXT_407371 [Caerostris extrusa]|uniref:Uncharacterized protein n=1 Tax=Caerostris extrusa TaxID=172846 RepID=A0AAV4XQS4_CAEEX|nr:hypothetical protein CEXT_407371 [Caerostris extrusa]